MIEIIQITGTIIFGIALIGFALFFLIQGIKEKKEIESL